MATDYRKYILSSGTHYISNSDENGKYKGAKAVSSMHTPKMEPYVIRQMH